MGAPGMGLSSGSCPELAVGLCAVCERRRGSPPLGPLLPVGATWQPGFLFSRESTWHPRNLSSHLEPVPGG